MDSRAQFEAYWSTQKSKFHKDRYEPFKNIVWEAWQASRAAVVVELPQRLSPTRSGMGYTLIPNDNGDAYHCDDVLIKLRAAGITV